jgi:capsular exopolysaccharide synthesis family protein
MELIERALAKARAENEKARGGGDTDVAGSATPEAKRQPVSEQPARPAEIEDIRYDKTRVEQAPSETWLQNRLVAADAGGIADTFRLLRTKVLQAMREHGWRTLAVVGATEGVGKSTIAANLALSISLDDNQTVLLVDADLRKPRTASYFGIQPELGLVDYLSNQAELQQVLVNPGVPRLVLLPGRGSAPNSTELMGSRRMQELVPQLRERYESRLVLFDLPPLLATGDALSFLPRFDCSLMVVEDGGNTAAQLVEAKRMLECIPSVGWVLNKQSARAAEYYHQHYYYGDKT